MHLLDALNTFGQLTATCTINGEPRPIEDCEQAFALAGILLIPILLIGLALFVFWVMAIIHVFSNADVPNRTLWIVLLLVIGGLAAVAYFFVVKRPYDKQKAAGGMAGGMQQPMAQPGQPMPPQPGAAPAAPTAPAAPQPAAPEAPAAPQNDQTPPPPAPPVQ